MNAGTFNCEQCDRKFSTRWNLQQHVSKRHSKKKEKTAAQIPEAQDADIQLLFSAQAYKIGEFIVYVTKNDVNWHDVHMKYRMGRPLSSL